MISPSIGFVQSPLEHVPVQLSCDQAKEGVLLPSQWGLGLCSTPWFLHWVWKAAISGLCLKCPMCFPTAIKCCGSSWFSYLLEMHIILFSILELFYGKVKGWGRLFCNLLTLMSIYHGLTLITYLVIIIKTTLNTQSSLRRTKTTKLNRRKKVPHIRSNNNHSTEQKRQITHKSTPGPITAIMVQISYYNSM